MCRDRVAGRAECPSGCDPFLRRELHHLWGPNIAVGEGWHGDQLARGAQALLGPEFPTPRWPPDPPTGVARRRGTSDALRRPPEACGRR